MALCIVITIWESDNLNLKLTQQSSSNFTKGMLYQKKESVTGFCEKNNPNGLGLFLEM